MWPVGLCRVLGPFFWFLVPALSVRRVCGFALMIADRLVHRISTELNELLNYGLHALHAARTIQSHYR